MVEQPRQNEDRPDSGENNPPHANQRAGNSEDCPTVDSSMHRQPGEEHEESADMVSAIGQRETSDPETIPLNTPHDAGTPRLLEDDVSTLQGLDKLPSAGPDRIASFRLLGVIGLGGMGMVYLALQDRPRRHVALKVMKSGVVSEQALRRFEFESELLGRLVHPGIAQIYEAGTWDDGSGAAPYFAMEYIPSARSITTFCRDRNLGTRERIELVRLICDAVGFGHGKGIIHRDLKPGNLLVGSSGSPKVIDFGVARSADSNRSITMETEMHTIVGTLQYMAPEQCTRDALYLDTSADVYALGVTMYQLLTGQLPYDLTGHPLASAIRVISETVPKRMWEFDRSFAGPLETIIQKAMAKDAADRYRTASDLGDDLQRWLNDEPITAVPTTIMVLVRRAMRRNKGVVAAITAMVVFLIVAVVVGVFGLMARNDALEAQSEVLQTENRLLEEQTQKREMVGTLINHFMIDTYNVLAPLSGSQEAREELINLSLEYIERLREQATDDPGITRLLAEALQQAGMNLWSMSSGNRGRVADAVDKYEESIVLADSLYATDYFDSKSRMLAVRGRLFLYNAYRAQGKATESERVLDEATPLLEHVNLETAELEDARAVVGIRLKRAAGSGERPDKDPALISLLDASQRVLNRFPQHRGVRRDATIAWNYAGFAWAQQGEHERALELYNQSLAERQSLLQGAEEQNTARRDVLNVHRYVCTELINLNRLDEVIENYDLEIIPLARSLHRRSSADSRARKDLAKALAEQAGVLVRLNRSDDAVERFTESRSHWLQIIEDAGGDMFSDFWTTQAMLRLEIDLAGSQFQADQRVAAEETIDRAVILAREALAIWPEQESIQSMYDQARRVRTQIMSKG